LAAAGVAVKIATFNINNINKRLPNLLAWLKSAKPDIVCLQELKAEQKDFPAAALKKAGYNAVWQGQKTWNGVAILARKHEIHLTRDRMPGDPSDKQSRYIEAAINGMIIGCIYLPNGNPQPGPKFEYKLAWLERLIRHARELKKSEVPVVLAGDYNVVPTEFDIYENHSYADDALLQPESRSAYARLLKQGWTDALRTLYPEERLFTYWSYLRHRWPNNKGLRLDHFLLSSDLAKRLEAGGVDRLARSKEGSSDHAPAWITIRK
jgi:exodeoxyribonuclease-3